MPDRIRSLVYLDAFVPENGKTLFDYLPDDGKGDRRTGRGPWRWLEGSAATGVGLRGQCGRRRLGGSSVHDAPAVQFEAPARISGACDDIANIGYILASGFDGPFGQFYAKAGERRWWQEELACGHDVMLDMPNELTALLLQRTSS